MLLSYIMHKHRNIVRFVNAERGYIDVGDGCWRRHVLVTS